MMFKRTITGLILAIVLIPLLLLGDWYFAVGVGILGFIATYELLMMFSSKEPILRKLCITVPLWSAATIIFGFIDNTMVLPMLVIGVIVFLIGMILNKHITANACVMMIFSYLYGGFLFYSMVILRNINIWILAIVFITVMLTDVGGYIFGYLFGKHKLCPTISPKKTIEGAVLGTIFGVCCGTGAYFVVTRLIEEVVFSTFSEMHIAIEILCVVGITLLLAVTGQLGDLVASKLKRAYDIKDFGKIFPGHGGVLDRFDSTLIAGALMFVICYMIGVI